MVAACKNGVMVAESGSKASNRYRTGSRAGDRVSSQLTLAILPLAGSPDSLQQQLSSSVVLNPCVCPPLLPQGVSHRTYFKNHKGSKMTVIKTQINNCMVGSHHSMRIKEIGPFTLNSIHLLKRCFHSLKKHHLRLILDS